MDDDDNNNDDDTESSLGGEDMEESENEEEQEENDEEQEQEQEQGEEQAEEDDEEQQDDDDDEEFHHQERNGYDLALKTLLDENIDTEQFDCATLFNFGQELIQEEEEEEGQEQQRRLTPEQATRLADALLKNKIVELFIFDMQFCPLAGPAMSRLIEYIRSSPRLQEMVLGYQPLELEDTGERDMVQEEEYKTQLDGVLRAVRDNPCIQDFTIHSSALSNTSPEAMYDLLTVNKSLTKFRLGRVTNIPASMARSIATGVSQNPSIKDLCLIVDSRTNLDFIISGLGASAVECLSLYTSWGGGHNISTRLWEAASRMILLTPTLTDFFLSGSFNIGGDHDDDMEGAARSLGKMLRHVDHPACNLKKLSLDSVSLASLEEDSSDVAAHVGGGDTRHVDHQSKNRMNSTPNLLQSLSLKDVEFQNPSDVRLLRNMRGLQEVDISRPTYVSSSYSSPSSDDLAKEEETLIQDYAKFIRRNEKLAKVQVDVDLVLHRFDNAHVHGVLQAARYHRTLTVLTIGSRGSSPWMMDAVLGSSLSNVVQETTSLQELKIVNMELEQAHRMPLPRGVFRLMSKSLKVLHFISCAMDVPSVIEILQSISTNQALQDVAFENLESLPFAVDDNGGDTALAQALSHVFQRSKSLVSFMLSGVDLRSVLSESLIGLRGNKTMKSLVFKECPVDNAAIVSFARTLESSDTTLVEVGLGGNIGDDEASSTGLVEGVKEFLRRLPRMPTIEKVHFGSTLPSRLDDESRRLLLSAVQEKKTIFELPDLRQFDNLYGQPRLRGPVFAPEILHYLKLNRFGRRLLDSTNIVCSLWPRILSPIASQPKDADALFYFVREYFSRQSVLDSEPKRRQAAQDAPSKRARLG